ncbi:uncharacterized protein EV422DRAFT_349594 [Fimicolochytrium jonesii]|uniref:uncharacterized protein n=1 Tax=Fimicolochytrium jonesii TaxID=1396493 RepID=UPI0022FDDDF9|nr:uncharacterized protein EV422DRAFT_349594 [Fimicolochytrium jonesii]KAI8815613.1 hypothetical protein EV422DRAFT_349594 [Fimicolochytrium jonesii]
MDPCSSMPASPSRSPSPHRALGPSSKPHTPAPPRMYTQEEFDAGVDEALATQSKNYVKFFFILAASPVPPAQNACSSLPLPLPAIKPSSLLDLTGPTVNNAIDLTGADDNKNIKVEGRGEGKRMEKDDDTEEDEEEEGGMRWRKRRRWMRSATFARRNATQNPTLWTSPWSAIRFQVTMATLEVGKYVRGPHFSKIGVAYTTLAPHHRNPWSVRIHMCLLADYNPVTSEAVSFLCTSSPQRTHRFIAQQPSQIPPDQPSPALRVEPDGAFPAGHQNYTPPLRIILAFLDSERQVVASRVPGSDDPGLVTDRRKGTSFRWTLGP